MKITLKFLGMDSWGPTGLQRRNRKTLEGYQSTQTVCTGTMYVKRK